MDRTQEPGRDALGARLGRRLAPVRRWSRVAGQLVRAAIALIFIGFVLANLTEEPAPPPPPAAAVAPVLHTAEGLSALVAAVRAEFGTTEVVSAQIGADHAVLQRPVPGAPHRAAVYGYKDGLAAWGQEVPRDPRLPLVDLAGIDAEGVARLVREAPAVVGVDLPATVVAIVGDEGALPRMTVKVDNHPQAGTLRAGLDGTIDAVLVRSP